MPYTYDYPRPAVAVDCVIFGLDESELKLLLIQRKHDPFAGRWALPGGFVEMDESLEEAARRELEEETGMRKVFLEQLYTFGGVDRDPRYRVISVAYFALVQMHHHRVQAATDASDAQWFDAANTPPLGFDHAAILQTAHQRLQNKIRYQPIGFELLPAKFTLRQLQALYETILARGLDRRNFRRKILEMGVLEELDELETNVAHRAARLYRFNKSEYQRLERQGFNFEI